MGEEFYFFNLYYWASLAKIHLGFEKFFFPFLLDLNLWNVINLK